MNESKILNLLAPLGGHLLRLFHTTFSSSPLGLNPSCPLRTPAYNTPCIAAFPSSSLLSSLLLVLPEITSQIHHRTRSLSRGPLCKDQTRAIMRDLRDSGIRCICMKTHVFLLSVCLQFGMRDPQCPSAAGAEEQKLKEMGNGVDDWQ